MHTQAVLRAARDFEYMSHKRSEGSKEAPLLIPELFEALQRFGRELLRGEEGTHTNQGELPELASISWEGVCLKLGDKPPRPPTERFMAPGSVAVAQARLQELAELRRS